MTAAIRNVALFGASGKLGQPLLPALLAANFKVTIIARESAKKLDYPPSAAITKVSDAYSKDEVVSALRGQDAVIVALAYSANAAHHRTIIDAAAEAGVKHIIPNHWASNAELPIIRASAERSEALDKDIDYIGATHSSSNMGWTAIVTGIFFDLAFPYGLLGFSLKDQSAEIWDSGSPTFSASTNEDIAKATIAVLQNPGKVRNQYVYTSSFSTSQNQLLGLVEKLSGKKWEVKHVTREGKIKSAEEVIKSGAQGMPWLMAQGTLAASALFGGEEYQADFEKTGRSSNETLGLEAGDVEQSVKHFMI